MDNDETAWPAASLYVRLSHRADAANTSKDNMLAELYDLCRVERLRPAYVHVDDGISGAVRNRPEFLRWLADARDGRVSALLAHDVDRMTREGLNVAAHILDVVEGKDSVTGKPVSRPVRLLDTHGVDSANGVAFRLLFLIKAEAARQERERSRERVAGRAGRLRLEGRWPGGTAPYGYRTVPIHTPAGEYAGKTLEICEPEATALREAADLVLTGVPVGRVSRWLNHHAPPPRRAAEWTRVTTRQALVGEHLLGRVVIGGVVQRDESGVPVTPFPAILDLPTSLALRAALAPRAHRERAPRRPARLASQLVECSGCGRYLTVVATKTRYRPRGGGAERTYDLTAYRCQRHADGAVCPRPVVVSALPFEAHLERRFLDNFGHAPMMRQVVAVGESDELARLEEDLSLTLAQLGQSATPATFARLQALQARRDALVSAPREPVVTMVPVGRSMAEEWVGRDVEGRREMLADAYAVLRLHPGRRGGKGNFDPARLEAVPAEGVHDPGV